MQTVLHILTRPADELTRLIHEQQRALPETSVEVVDLTAPAPDYEGLVEKIFSADSVSVE